MTYHLLNRASQKCSFNKSSSTHSPFPNVRAYIHSHLHRDSFHCHFTPFIGSVLDASASICPRIPGCLLWQGPLLGCGFTIEIGQCGSNIPTPTPPLSMHHYIPAALPQHPLPQRFWPETRALGGSSVPRAFPPSLSVFFDVLPLAAVSVSLCHFLTHKLTDRYTTATCLCPSCTSFPQQSGERGVPFSSGDSSVELIY